MRIRDIEARPGERAFGYLESSRTVSQIPIHIPVNIVRGIKDGPTLMVSAAVHGAEIIGTLGIGKVLRDIDPKKLRGTLIAVPVANTSAFEFGARTTYWDGQNLNRNAKAASPDGSPTAQLAYIYLNELVVRADALIDIHSGTSNSYVWYTIYPGEHGSPEVVERSRKMAIAFGLRQVFRSRPATWVGGLKDAAVEMGKPAITPEIGGGADFLRHGKEQIEICARGIFNVMRLMGMWDGEIVTESDTVQICDGKHEIYAGKNAGIMLVEVERGAYLKKGDTYATVYHPFTGEVIGKVIAPESGTVLNTGVVWPVVNQGQWIGLLGDVVEEVRVNASKLKW